MYEVHTKEMDAIVAFDSWIDTGGGAAVQLSQRWIASVAHTHRSHKESFAEKPGCTS